MTRPSVTRRIRRARQRGAVALEFAIVIPLLATLAFGTVEMGAAWSDSQTVLTSTRSAARSLAQYGDDQQGDRDALLSIEAAFANSNLTVTAVVIYESDDAVNGGAAPDACVTAAINGQNYNGSEPCNVYTERRYNRALGNNGHTRFGCVGNDFDRNWCPTSRTRDQATATFIGVQVFATRTSVTGADFVPVPTDLEQFSVMRLEPLPS